MIKLTKNIIMTKSVIFWLFKVEIDIRRHNYDIEIQNWDTESLQNNESELWTIMGKKKYDVKSRNKIKNV